jgi:hypothetical protein
MEINIHSLSNNLKYPTDKMLGKYSTQLNSFGYIFEAMCVRRVR